MPTSRAGTMPKRAMMSAPGTAAIANSIGGRLDSQPMPVSERWRSACSSGTTGGIANTVSRRHAPESQSKVSRMTRERILALSAFGWLLALLAQRLRAANELRAYMIREADVPDRNARPRYATSVDEMEDLERAKGFDPSTPTLARLCSTPELHPHPRRVKRPAARAEWLHDSYAKELKALQPPALSL